MTQKNNQGWEAYLVDRAQSGESVAFELLFDLHRDSLKALAMRLLRNHEDAGDAVQEASVKALRAMDQFEKTRPVLPWLARICANCCVDIMRSKKQISEPIEKFEFALASSDDVERSAVNEFELDAMRSCIEKLPKHYRNIIVMRHYREMDVSEIALEMKKPEGTVKSWLFRARALLRKEMEPLLAEAGHRG